MLLAINTCLRRVDVALIDEDQGVVVSEVSEISHRDHTEKIFDFIQQLLGNKDASGILQPDKVLVVSGPGAFTSIRIGVVTANTIGYASNAQMYGIDLMTLFQQESVMEGVKFPIYVSAGKSEIYEIRDHGDYALENPEEFIQNIDSEFYGDVSEHHAKMLEESGKQALWKDRALSFGEAVLKLSQSGALDQYKVQENEQGVSHVLPTYLKPPNISVSKKEI